MFTGTHTALVTPFREGKVDWAALEALLEKQIEGKVDGVVPVGTTGESPTLSHEEHVEVIRFCVEKVASRCQVIAGTGSNATQEAIELTQAAEKAGADASLQVSPYYNKPTQEGLYQHFAAIARSTKLPIVLYSIPGRCVVEIAVETVARLAKDFDNIVCIKEAGGKVERIVPLKESCPKSFTILSGDDALTLPFMREGAVGVISVASNLLPREVSDMVRAQEKGDFSSAEMLQKKLTPIFRDLFIETNPMPIKAALAMKGWIAEEYRLPMVPMQSETRARLETTLRDGGWL